MTFRRFFLTTQLLAAVLFLADAPIAEAQASSETLARTRIAFINPGKEDEFFWPEVSDTMRAAAEQLGFDLEIAYAGRDAQRMIRLGHEAINQPARPDFLILVNEFQAAPELLDAADAKGIKVLMLLNAFVGNQLRDMGAPGQKYRNWIGSLVPSNDGAGRRMAESLMRCMDATDGQEPAGKRHVMALAGDGRTPASLERTGGMHAAFSGAGNIVIDRHFQTNWQGAEAVRLTRNYLAWAKGHQIDSAGIWAANDALAIGAVEAVYDAGLEPGKDICIVGLNWSPEAIELVHAGAMAATDGGHFLAGAWAMVMIHDYLEGAVDATGGRKPIGNVSFEMASIDTGNVGTFVAKLGNRDWRRIPFRQFVYRPGGYDFSLERILDLLGG